MREGDGGQLHRGQREQIRTAAAALTLGCWVTGSTHGARPQIWQLHDSLQKVDEIGEGLAGRRTGVVLD